jgi:hypothetical protein
MGPIIVRVSDSLGKSVACGGTPSFEQARGRLIPWAGFVMGGVALISDRVGRCSRSAGLIG